MWRKALSWVHPVAAFLVLTACGEPPEPLTASERHDRLASIAEAVRVLPFQQEVPIVTLTREEYEAAQDASIEQEDAADTQLLHDTWGRLGFFAPGDDTGQAKDAADDLVLASYDYLEEAITVVGTPANSTMIHEYVHALQDQHFNLEQLDAGADTLDAFLAARGVAEGDATLAEARFEVGARYDVDLDRVDWRATLLSLRQAVDDLLADSEHPLFFLAYTSFAYVYGQEYMLERLTGATIDDPLPTGTAPYDWAPCNDAFTLPPLSTGQVLELSAQGQPADVGLIDVPAEMVDRFEYVGHDTVGVWLSHILTYPVTAPKDALASARGWRGDRVLFVRQTDTQGYATVWTSAWATAAGAADVAALLWAVYRAEPGEDGHGWSADGERVHIFQRNDMLVVIKNLTNATAEEMAEYAFAGSAGRAAPPLGERTRLRELLVRRLAPHRPAPRGLDPSLR